ncbi:MAG: CPBP family intramembrane metalloprotease [Oxalobacteraceae bacterium]|nr:MAG: CPBP family intramembrane metalloprotease [Oxalobacteraceae bacterium]
MPLPQAPKLAALRPLGLFLAFTAVTLVGGALLAPPLYHLGQWAIAQDLVPQLRPFHFEKYFNRAVLVLAVACLLPLLRALGVRRAAPRLALPGGHRLLQLLAGTLIGVLGLFGVALCMVEMGVLHVARWPQAREVALAAVAGAAVGLIEECFFRGALFTALRRTMRWPWALGVVSLIFAVLHFIGPDPEAGQVTEVTWRSGLSLLPSLLHAFASPRLLGGTFVTLLLMGLVLGYAVLGSNNLMLALGLHSGWVFALKLVSKSCVQARVGVWMGDDLRSGLAPALMMLLTLALLAAALRWPAAGEATAARQADDDRPRQAA